jgi:PKD repeat protein
MFTSLARVQAQEETVTYYSREELPVSLSQFNPESELSIEIPDALADVRRAILTLTVSDSNQRGEAIFEVEDEDYSIPPSGSGRGTFEFEIPVEDLSSLVTIHFTLENRIRDGIEINELSLELTLIGSSNSPPIAVPGDTYHGVEGSELQFDGSTSYDPDGVIQAYLWTFGDNISSTESKPRHSYLSDGEYFITLTVTDNDDASTTAATLAIIDDIDPIAFFSVTSVATTATPIYRFTDDSTSYDGIVQWFWDFGDGAQSTDPEPLHAYPMPGNYTVTLMVSEADGDQATLTVLTPISEDPLSPLVIELTPSTQTGLSGDSLTYLIEVSNQVPTYYEASTFLLTPQAPNDWNASFSLTRLTISPGETLSSLLTLTSPLSAVLGEYEFTITATDKDNSERTSSVAGSYVLTGPPQVTVSALVEERPPVRFTVTCVASSDSILQEIRLYINDQVVKTWTQAGTYTYDWVPSTTDPVTYSVTAITSSGLIVSDPQSGEYSLTQLGIPWNLFLYGLLAVVTLFLVIYFGMHR